LELPTSSENTMRISDSDSDRRSPAKILGSAAGNTTWRSTSTRDSPNTRAVSSCSGSMDRTPSAVLSTSGQIAPKTIVATSIWVPIRNTTRNTAVSAGGGTARKNCSSGST
jgi:hypothetical protein